jgi:ABC-type Zn2+ transport system substrate-binding protein/surface adhesin
MIGDAVKAVVGDTGKVEALLGSGIDPHSYKPTRSDIARLSSADIVFYNGLLLEGKMTDALVRVASAGRPVVAVTEALDEEYLLEPEEFAGQYDPHVWMDVAGWKKAVDAVRERMIAFRPALAGTFRDNAARYLGELDKLDNYAREDSRNGAERVARAGDRARRLQLFRPRLRLRGAGHSGHQHGVGGRAQAHPGTRRHDRRAQDRQRSSSSRPSPTAMCAR